MASQYFDKDAVEAITSALDECRNQALAQFMNEFIGILEKRGYNIADLLDSLACWVGKQPKYREVIQYLEKAGDEAFRANEMSK